MTALEERMAQLRREVHDLAKRVRLDAVAERFIAGDHEIREGDAFLAWGSTAHTLSNVSSDGKWTFDHAEWHHTDPSDHKRLYTIEEVAEIVAKVSKP